MSQRTILFLYDREMRAVRDNEDSNTWLLTTYVAEPSTMNSEKDNEKDYDK